MARNEIDTYLVELAEPKRSTLEELHRTIRDILPDAQECISYGVPAYKVQGKAVAGFAAYKDHLSYLPHSGSVLAELNEDVSAYQTSKGSLRFAVDKALPERLVKKLIAARMRELGLE